MDRSEESAASTQERAAEEIVALTAAMSELELKEELMKAQAVEAMECANVDSFAPVEGALMDSEEPSIAHAEDNEKQASLAESRESLSAQMRLVTIDDNPDPAGEDENEDGCSRNTTEEHDELTTSYVLNTSGMLQHFGTAEEGCLSAILDQPEDYDEVGGFDYSAGADVSLDAVKDISEELPRKASLSPFDEVAHQSQASQLASTPSRESRLSPKANQTEKLHVSAAPTLSFSEAGKAFWPLEKVLQLCGQKEVKSLSECLNAMSLQRKIGEATYSEVFEVYDNSVEPPQSIAVKIMPFTASQNPLHQRLPSRRSVSGGARKSIPLLYNGSEIISLHDVAQEILVTKQLSNFRGARRNGSSNFVELQGVKLCHGPYPQNYLDAWDKYASDRESENDRPDVLPPSQLYAVLCLSNGGIDLEHTRLLRRWTQARSLLLQLIFSIAEAETLVGFEHRDLHWGNILVADTKESQGMYRAKRNAEFVEICVPFDGVKTTIIDYTLSRCQTSRSLLLVSKSNPSNGRVTVR
ncbi:hypothetical protein DFJ73DRAFT_823016 [Zopfochytrium polystomum]|nr:hypothetical protein DFJ73DRAFT_823016 [Zopfochytrium polystomum]